MTGKRCYRKRTAKLTAFVLTTVILVQSGMTAYASEDIPVRGMDSTYGEASAQTEENAEGADAAAMPAEDGADDATVSEEEMPSAPAQEEAAEDTAPDAGADTGEKQDGESLGETEGNPDVSEQAPSDQPGQADQEPIEGETPAEGEETTEEPDTLGSADAGEPDDLENVDTEEPDDSEDTPSEDVQTGEDTEAEDDMTETESDLQTEVSVSDNALTREVMEMEPAVEARAAVTVLTAPVIKSVSPRDTTAVIKFVPSAEILQIAGGADENGGRGYYTVELTDKVMAKAVEVVDLSTMADGADNVCGYRFSIDSDSSQAAPLYTCELQGLSSNKAYTVAITAHYERSGADPLEKASKGMSFTTKKVMLTTGGSLVVSCIRMEELRSNPDSAGSVIDYANGVSVYCNESYALFAEVSNLSRALETEKLTWTVTDTDGKAAGKKVAVKASVSSYEAQIEAIEAGDYIVTAKSTVTKAPLAEFVIHATPEGKGTDSARLSLQSELFYYYRENGGSDAEMERASA